MNSKTLGWVKEASHTHKKHISYDSIYEK
jgi:hypothetical protein